MATVAWLGGAPPVPKVIQYTPPTATTITIIVDGSSQIVITFGSTPTTAQSARAIYNAVNGTAIQDGETRTGTGNTIGEFNILTATLDDATTPTLVYLTGKSDGRPFTCTINAGSGTTNQTDTGPHHFTEAENWSGGSVPVNDDVLVFDDRAVSSLLYDIDVGGTRYEMTSTKGFKHQIGLPDVYQANNSSLNFDETLTTDLTFDDLVSGGSDIRIDSSSSLIRVSINGQANILVSGSGPRSSANTPPVQILCGASSTLKQTGGDCGVAYFGGQTATLSDAYLTGAQSILEIGDGCSLATFTMDAGLARIRDLPSGNLEVNGGTLLPQFTGSGAEIAVGSNGIVDFTTDPRARTFTKIKMYKGSQWIDPQGSVTSTTLELHGCNPNDVKISAPSHRKWTIATI